MGLLCMHRVPCACVVLNIHVHVGICMCFQASIIKWGYVCTLCVMNRHVQEKTVLMWIYKGSVHMPCALSVCMYVLARRGSQAQRVKSLQGTAPPC